MPSLSWWPNILSCLRVACWYYFYSVINSYCSISARSAYYRITMSKRSIRGESPSLSSSTAHKRHATAPEEEGPLASASSFLAQVSPSSDGKMPLDLIADSILPFVADRATWISVYCASRELRLAGKKMAPPWPNKAFKLGQRVRYLAFSPQLAFVIDTGRRFVIRVWDRCGNEETLYLRRGDVSCLE